MTKKIKYLQVREKPNQRTELVILHGNKDLTFLHPAYGPNIYAHVAQEIGSASLQRPTMAETASLVHAAFNADDKYSQEIKNIMKRSLLWAFTGNMYVPHQGVFIEDNPVIKEYVICMDKEDLITRLEKNDPSVRFVPFGFQIETMAPMELAKNAYVIALAGEEGVEKLAEVAGKHRHQPYLRSFIDVDEPITQVSALSSSWDGGDHRLIVIGNSYGSCGDYSAFGIQRTDEASLTRQ